uniref:Pepsin inhibitor-3-like repeated domain-containing protein n=1 Tax=Acrobeloides nanus TaxID=290746 RepID=A0A914CQD0_9BILA
MYLIFLISCACIIFVQAHPVNKRDIFDSFPFGGNLGCVVTGNTLYINGLQDRQLTPSEINELQQYQSSLNSFQQQMQQFKQQMHQMRDNGQWNGGRMHARMGSMMQNGPNGPNGPQDNSNMPTPPTPPTRPSFCNDNVTTQYIFDGCKVQDNKVYIGNNYARDLTPAEQNQLQQFNNQMDA